MGVAALDVGAGGCHVSGLCLWRSPLGCAVKGTQGCGWPARKEKGSEVGEKQ